MRLAFMGTPDFAVPTLDALAAAGHEIAAVYSQPPRPAGRGKGLRASPVHRRAEALGLEVRTPLSLKGAEEQAAFAALGLDVAVVAAYGLILPQPILDAPRLGCLNVHGSLLPRWRGAAPVQRAILAGDVMTGVQVMQMERGLDTGPVRATWETPVDGKTAGALTEELAEAGARLMVAVLADPDAFPPAAQLDEGVTYAAKIDKAEARLDFTRSAAEIERQVRAFNPAPGAFFEWNAERVRVLAADVVSGDDVPPRRRGPRSLMDGDEAAGSRPAPGYVIDDRLLIACANGAVRPTLLQRAGRAPLPLDAFLRGFPIAPGTVLG